MKTLLKKLLLFAAVLGIVGGASLSAPTQEAHAINIGYAATVQHFQIQNGQINWRTNYWTNTVEVRCVHGYYLKLKYGTTYPTKSIYIYNVTNYYNVVTY